MKVTVEYRYWKTEIPYRCRIARPIEYTATLTVTIQEVSQDDAPVAIIQKLSEWREMNLGENMYLWHED